MSGMSAIEMTGYSTVPTLTEAIRALCQPTRAILDHRLGVFVVDQIAHPQPRDPVCGGATPQIMTGRYRREGARIIVEANRVVQARRFHHVVKVAPDAVQAIEEPPRRPQL